MRKITLFAVAAAVIATGAFGVWAASPTNARVPSLDQGINPHPPKGRAMRCTVLGLTSNLAAVLHTLLPPSHHASSFRPICAPSVLPEPIEAVGAQFGISHRVHDVAMSQEVLQRAGIDPLIG
jgi:hypothetical protein